MARERRSNPTTEAQREYMKVDSFKVTRANEYKKNGTIFFDVQINGLTVYGCTVVKRKSDGTEFISFPSQKGRDGNYYNVVYAYLSQADQDAIINAVFDLLDA